MHLGLRMDRFFFLVRNAHFYSSGMIFQKVGTMKCPCLMWSKVYVSGMIRCAPFYPLFFWSMAKGNTNFSGAVNSGAVFILQGALLYQPNRFCPQQGRLTSPNTMYRNVTTSLFPSNRQLCKSSHTNRALVSLTLLQLIIQLHSIENKIVGLVKSGCHLVGWIVWFIAFSGAFS